jgi:3-dehydrosphinganine reductase
LASVGLTGRPVLITGGSRGIGRAVAFELASQGAPVFLVARGAEALESTWTQVRARWPSLPAGRFPADVRDPDAMVAAVEAMRSELGSVGGVVCNAGLARPGYFEDLSEEVFKRSFEVSYLGSVWTVRAALPHLAPGSFISLVSSVAGYVGLFGYSAYAPAKAAVISLAEVLRQELAPRGVRVSVLCPPDTRTPGFEEENRTKPHETRVLAGKGGLMDADVVARRYVRALRRGRFLINVNARSWAYHRLKGWFPEIVRRAMDRMVARARPSVPTAPKGSTVGTG